MRRTVLLVCAAVPLLLLARPTLARDDRSTAAPGCPVPTLRTDYDLHELTAHLSLPVGGCAAREQRSFDLAMSVIRMDNHGSHDRLDGATTCGPYGPAPDADPDDPPAPSSCDFAMGVTHPETEAAQYHIDATYPGAAGKRTVTHVAFCRSDGEHASCEDLGMTAERDAER